jgi:hydrogenase maturation protease
MADNRMVMPGVGNLILRDEVVEVHAVRAFEVRKLPLQVEVIDAGTALMEVLPVIRARCS